MSRTSRITKHLSYANVVATLCLFMLLGAGAHAAGLAKNSVKSKHIKNGQVKTVDVANDAIDGTKVKESTLKGVNAATVGGAQVKKINFQVPFGTSLQNVVVFPGKFRIDAQCQNSGDFLDIAAFSGVDNSKISQVSVATADANDSDSFRDLASKIDDDFDANEGFGVDNVFDAADNTQISLTFATPGGLVIQVDLLSRLVLGGCSLTGLAIGG